MGIVIGLVAGAWISLVVIAVALCRMAGRADDATASAFIDREVVHAELNRRAAVHAVSRESGSHAVLFPH
ncbi:MAG TPA: hypothetical protein VG186_05785 [Solirubrobacteraceae bacterium]|jgi:hypothetical protein|nr:hypothetical protein [Solirubrobacteraceae bacterium]